MNTGVYIIKNLINGDSYIGSTIKSGFLKRKIDHFTKLKCKKHHSIILQHAYNKYGRHNFLFEILEECLPENCIIREQFYLDTLNPKYNVRKIAETNFAVNHSTKTKKLMSDIKLGAKNPFYGKHHSASAKQKISSTHIGNSYAAGNIGWKHSNDTIQHLSKINSGHNNPNYGKSASLVTRNKMSTSKIGRLHPLYSGEYVFKNMITNETIICAKFELANRYSLNRGAISQLCKNKLGKHKNWICIGKNNK